jgi:hypothetical protein
MSGGGAHRPAEHVCFSRRRITGLKSVQHVRQFLVFGLIGFGGILVWMAVLLQRGGSSRLTVLSCTSAALVMLASVWLFLRIQRGRRHEFRAEFEQLPRNPDPAARVHCIGVSEEIMEVGPLEDLPFEPAIFHAALAVMPSTRTITFSWMAATILGVGLIFGSKPLFGSGIRGPFGIWAAYAVVFGAIAWLRPVYFRIVPGRLDVLWYGPFRSKPLRVDRYDLRSSKVLVDLRQKAVVIGEDNNETDFCFALVRGGRRLAYMLLLAAISTHEPGPLPDDEMLG